MANTTLVLGGARSGKSRFALRRAESNTDRPLYIATAQAGDLEMQQRIDQHQADRGQQWTTIEAPLNLTAGIIKGSKQHSVIVVDCLTLWLSNLMHADQDVVSATDELIAGLSSVEAQTILVSNEVGMGIVPESELGRAFRDEQGRLNQRIATAAAAVVFIAAGLPLVLKGGGANQ